MDSGNTAWVLVSAAMVLLMTPGLALFYGGLTRAKSVVNMMMKSLAALGIVSVLWVLYGYSFAFADGNALIGGASQLGLSGIGDSVDPETGLPTMAFIGFQLMFAVISVALISGGVADRMKFQSWVIFTVVWATLVYFPVAHWVWGGGFIGADGLGAFDFAGGTAVHVNAGAAALALVLVLGKRLGWPYGTSFTPHNLPLVMLGTGLLWFGWFGFNAGSQLAADGLAALVLVNTQIATAAAIGGWLLLERMRGNKPSVLGACSGAVSGLVAITPACAFVSPLGAIAIGLLAGAGCALAVSVKHRLGYDDALDVVGIHLVGGALGSVLIGVFALPSLTEGAGGLLYGGGAGMLAVQAAAVGIVGGFSFVLAGVIGLALKFTTGIRVSGEVEAAGIDTTEHAEAAYDLPWHGTSRPEEDPDPELTSEGGSKVGAWAGNRVRTNG